MSVLLISTGFAALLYLVSGIAIMSAMKKGSEAKASSLLRWPVLLGLVLHGYAVGQEMFTAEAVHFGFGYAVSVMFFFAVVTLLIESWVHRIHALVGIILIAAAFGALFPVFFQGQVVPAADWTLAFRWHLVFALAAYSFMMIAFVQAVLMMLQNTRLRAKGLSANDDLFDSLPGLVVMERVFFRIVATGFFCLTLVLILGAVVTKELQGVYFLFDHKAVLTWISWLVFGVLLLGRTVWGWRAKTALRLFWAGFVVFAVAYFVYSFVLEVF